MITLKKETSELIRIEMESIPEEYHQPQNSLHEGLGVLREEYVELENEIFFGLKKCKVDAINSGFTGKEISEAATQVHKQRVRHEAVQVAAMACRIIQELT